GNNAEIFAHNVDAKGIDLRQLDFAVISHRHGDHTSGLNHLFKVNPGVKVYAPQENFGVFGAALPGTFYKRNESLPQDMRYFDGKAPETLRFGTPWPEGNFTWVTKTTEVAPGFYLILLNGTWGVDLEVKELSLAIDTPDGSFSLWAAAIRPSKRSGRRPRRRPTSRSIWSSAAPICCRQMTARSG